MKAHLCDFCWSGVGYDIYNFCTVQQLFFWVVMQVLFYAQLSFYGAYFAEVLYVNVSCWVLMVQLLWDDL